MNRWIDEGYLKCEEGTYPAQLLHLAVSDMAATRIRAAITNSLRGNAPDGSKRIKAIVDPYAPTGSTQSINFATTAPLFRHPSQFQTERRLRLEQGKTNATSTGASATADGKRSFAGSWKIIHE